MATHWTSYRQGEATKAQCDYLDMLATEANAARAEMAAAGLDVSKMPELAHGAAVLDWCMVRGAPTKAEASAAIDRAKEKIAARREKVASGSSVVSPRDAALAQIRALMAQHHITAEELS